MTQLPVPVFVGCEPPEYWDDIEARQQQFGEDAGTWLRDQRRPSLAGTGLSWRDLGFEPRWVGYDTVDCAAALDPSIFSSHGADEYVRFRLGAQRRGETALVICRIGRADEPRNVRNVFDLLGDSVSIGQTHTTIYGREIGRGARVRAAAVLGDADGQLARRLLSCNSPLTWRSLSLSGAVLESVHGREEHAAEGVLMPILETELGEPVVAAWVSPDGIERRYVVPVETPWTLLLQWLLEQALPEIVPGAMRRARRSVASEEDLLTRRERDCRAALAGLESDYIARRGVLERQLEDAQSDAAEVRYGLLYGTGQQLVDAVRSVFESAGIGVVDLDEQFGDTKNADLLCSYGGRSRLVEVKSASGSAPERAYQDLLRHLREWPSVSKGTHVDGGALVMSHDLRTVPQERTPRPYARPEFLASQTEPVVSALDLFTAWRDEEAITIRRLLFGSLTGVDAKQPKEATAPVGDLDPLVQDSGKRWWLGRHR